jgi:Lrp/AsnC family transcriptional regulator
LVDDLDRKILRVIQRDNSLALEEIAEKVGSSKSPVWNRIKKLKANGIIAKEVALLDADQLGLTDTFFVAIRTDQHSAEWSKAFAETLADMDEIQEAHRLTGEIDYILKVRVGNTREFDAFYKRFIGRINLFNVTSSLSMETMKETTALKI